MTGGTRVTQQQVQPVVSGQFCCEPKPALGHSREQTVPPREGLQKKGTQEEQVPLRRGEGALALGCGQAPGRSSARAPRPGSRPQGSPRPRAPPCWASHAWGSCLALGRPGLAHEAGVFSPGGPGPCRGQVTDQQHGVTDHELTAAGHGWGWHYSKELRSQGGRAWGGGAGPEPQAPSSARPPPRSSQAPPPQPCRGCQPRRLYPRPPHARAALELTLGPSSQGSVWNVFTHSQPSQ